MIVALGPGEGSWKPAWELNSWLWHCDPLPEVFSGFNFPRQGMLNSAKANPGSQSGMFMYAIKSIHFFWKDHLTWVWLANILFSAHSPTPRESSENSPRRGISSPLQVDHISIRQVCTIEYLRLHAYSKYLLWELHPFNLSVWVNFPQQMKIASPVLDRRKKASRTWANLTNTFFFAVGEALCF